MNFLKKIKKSFGLIQKENNPYKALRNTNLHFTGRFTKMSDPLYIWKTHAENKLIFKQFLDEIKKEKKFQPNPYTIGRLIYHMGNHGVYNDYILDMVDSSYEIFKNKFKKRSAFGFFLGSLRLSLPKNIIFFARAEYERFGIEKNFVYDKEEIVLLLDAIVVNGNLDRDEKIDILQNFIELIIMEDKYFNNYQRVFRVFKNLVDLEYFENKFFQIITLRLIFSKRFKRLEHIFYVLKELEKISNLEIYQNRYNFEREIEICNKLLNSKKEYTYRYNTEKKQFYTYSEMYNKRENYNSEQKEATFFKDAPENLQKIYDFKENVLNDPKLFKFDYNNLDSYRDLPPVDSKAGEEDLMDDYVSSEDVDEDEGEENYELPDELNN